MAKVHEFFKKHRIIKIKSRNNPSYQKYFNKQQGFTLVELLIALALGVILSAAAIQLFLTSSENARRQQASSQNQNNALFGFSELQKHLRRANYGARSTGEANPHFMNHLTQNGGIVLTPVNILNFKVTGAEFSNINSTNQHTSSLSNLTLPEKSDQLTIQYQAGRSGMFNCVGQEIKKNEYVIERYYVRSENRVTSNTNGLACASIIYNINKQLEPLGLIAGKGEIIIPNVDYFRVLLGVTDAVNFATNPNTAKIGYIPIPNDPENSLKDLRIVSLQVGILTHSTDAIATEQANSELSFNVLDKKGLKLNQNAQIGPTYLRNVYESTVLIRNARGGI